MKRVYRGHIFPSRSATSKIIRKRVVLLAWDYSRKGGIEEVSRQVMDVLKGSEVYDLEVWKYPRSNKLAFFVRKWLCFTGNKQTIYVFMHPYIFEHFRSGCPRFNFWPSVVWAHGIEVWGRFGKAYAAHIASATQIIASSNYTKGRVLENFPGANVSVVPLAPHGTPTEHHRSETQPFEILTVGRLAGQDRYKGHDLVLEALFLLRLKGIRIIYHVVGSGSDLGRLRQRSHDLDIAEHVIFHGYLNDADVVKLYGRSSLFVMPSHVIKHDHQIWSGEGLGLVYLEASNHGLPLIACNEGGQTDCVIDGQTGFLVSPDAAEIAERIEYLMSNREVGRRMGESARQFIARNFTPEKFRDGVLAAINEAGRIACVRPDVGCRW